MEKPQHPHHEHRSRSVECPVGSVRLGPYHIKDHALFVDVVSKAHPKRVTIALECAKSRVRPEGEQSVFLLPTDVGPGTGVVTHGVVFLMLHTIARDPALASVDPNTSGVIVSQFPCAYCAIRATDDSRWVQETVGSHVRHSCLEYIHVVIVVKSAFGPEEYASPEWEIYDRVLTPSSVVFDFLRPVFEGIDVELLVSALAAASGNLRLIALKISARGQSVWRIDRDETGQSITRIQDPKLTREIIEREERLCMYQTSRRF